MRMFTALLAATDSFHQREETDLRRVCDGACLCGHCRCTSNYVKVLLAALEAWHCRQARLSTGEVCLGITGLPSA